MASTAQQIITDAEAITKIDSQSIGLAGLETTMLLRVIDKANREYASKFQIGGGEPDIALRKEYGADFVDEVSLTSAAGFGDTQLLGDFANFYRSSWTGPSVGSAMIWTDDFPEYLDFNVTDATHLTLVTNTSLAYTHDSGDSVAMLYAIPDDFGSFRSEEGNRDGVRVDGEPYEFTTGAPTGRKFAIHKNSGVTFVAFPQGTTGKFYIAYNATATVIDGLSDTIDVPIEDEEFVIYRLVEHINRVLNVDYNKVVEARQLANKVILDGMKRRNVGKRLKTGRSWGVRSSSPFPSSLVNESL